MKKILPVLAAVMLLLSSAAAAESLPALPDEEPALPAFATMNEALAAVKEPGTCFDTDGTAVVMAMKAGEKYIRLITELDSRAQNLLERESKAGEGRAMMRSTIMSVNCRSAASRNSPNCRWTSRSRTRWREKPCRNSCGKALRLSGSGMKAKNPGPGTSSNYHMACTPILLNSI